MTECSACGFPLEEGDRFCGNCRTAVREGSEQKRIEHGTAVDVEEALDREGTRKSAIKEEDSSAARGENPVVGFNASRVLLEGSVLPLEFRIHSAQKLSRVVLSIRSPLGIRAEHKVHQMVQREDLLLDVAVPKGCCGTMGFEVCLAYEIDGRSVEMRGICRHEICPAAGAGNIAIDIQQGHAGDIQVSGLKELAAMSDTRTLLRELNAIEPRWEPLPMRVVSERAAANGHAALELETPGGPLRLFSGTSLAFGRSRENDLVTRLSALSPFLLDLANPNNPNRFISSRHGWLHRTEDGIYVVDGDMVYGTPSGGGTYLDGRRVAREKLPAHPAVLSLSGADATLPTIYAMRIDVSAEGVVLRPQEPRAGVVLWLFGALEFEGSTYEYRHDGFYRDGERIRSDNP